jgi:hypothetical protein
MSPVASPQRWFKRPVPGRAGQGSDGPDHGVAEIVHDQCRLAVDTCPAGSPEVLIIASSLWPGMRFGGRHLRKIPKP